MIVEVIVDCILAGSIIIVLIALVACIGAAIWAMHESPEKEPWNRDASERERLQLRPEQTEEKR